MYYKNASAVVIVYDVTDRESFDSIAKWIKEVEQYSATEENDSILYAMVANKIDMASEQVVDLETGMEYAKS